MNTKKKQAEAKGHKVKGGVMSSTSRKPKPRPLPHDHDITVGDDGVGEHHHNIIWHNHNNGAVTVTFGSAAGSPFEPPYDHSFPVPANGSLPTPIREDARGKYPYKTHPSPMISPHEG